MIKKLAIAVFVIMIASLSIAGCINNPSPPSSSPGSYVAPASPTSTPSSGGAVSLKVNSMTQSSQLGSQFAATPSPGRTFVVFDVTLTNLNKNNLYLGSPIYFKLTTSDGTVYQYTSNTFRLDNYLTGVLNTNPGDKVTGKVAFEIPQNVKATQLSYGDLVNGVVTVNL
ncbi:MAG: DUF4352 domain-containing protein [Halobacteriota archaeon]